MLPPRPGSPTPSPRPAWLRALVFLTLGGVILSTAGIFPYISPAPYAGPTRWPFPSAWLSSYREMLGDLRFAFLGVGAVWALGVAPSVFATSRRAVRRAAAFAVPAAAVTIGVMLVTGGEGFNLWGVPAAISTGAAEEVFWRAGILGILLSYGRSPRWSGPLGRSAFLALAVVLFGVFHFNVHLRLGASVLEALGGALLVNGASGIAACVLYLAWRDLGVAILAHVLVDLAGQVTGEPNLGVYGGATYATFAVLVLMGRRYRRERERAALPLPRPPVTAAQLTEAAMP